MAGAGCHPSISERKEVILTGILESLGVERRLLLAVLGHPEDLLQDVPRVAGPQGLQVILRDHPDRCMRLPMTPMARSLNLSNCVAIVVYEALRQQNFPNLATTEVLKGPDFLEKEKNHK